MDIARALLQKPQILFLDEPTTGLDPQTRKSIWNTIKRLQLNEGMTVFLTTHYMEEAAESDYVIVIDHGTIVAKGTPLELRTHYSSDTLRLFPANQIILQRTLNELQLDFKVTSSEFLVKLPDTIAAIPISSMANTSLMCFIVSFFKSHHAFSTAGTVIGTLIGFLTGIYLPIGDLPASVQFVIKVFPVSHAAALFRQVLMEEPMRITFNGIETKYLSEFKEYMGITYSFGGHGISSLTSILILVGTSVAFYYLSVLNLSRNGVRKSNSVLLTLKKTLNK